MTIRLQFVRQEAISSSLIAWMGAGEFSHVDYISAKSGALLGARHDFVGQKPRGVQIRPPGYVKWVRQVIFTLECPEERELRFDAFCRQQIGKPYDMSCIWGFISGRNWHNADAWICSELQAAALEIANICPPLYLASYKINPTTLAAIVSALGAKREDII